MENKKTIKKEVWQDLGRNMVLQRKGYFISYNPNPGIQVGGEGEETALVKDKKYYILLGDFRKQYTKLKTYKECKEFFKKNISKRGFWSN